MSALIIPIIFIIIIIFFIFCFFFVERGRSRVLPPGFSSGLLSALAPLWRSIAIRDGSVLRRWFLPLVSVCDDLLELVHFLFESLDRPLLAINNSEEAISIRIPVRVIRRGADLVLGLGRASLLLLHWGGVRLWVDVDLLLLFLRLFVVERGDFTILDKDIEILADESAVFKELDNR